METQVNQVAMREETSSYSFSGYRVGSDNLPVSYSTDEDFLKDLQTDNAAIADDGGITLIRGAGSYNPTAIFAKFYSTISIGDRVKLNDTQVRIDASIYRQKTDTALGIGPLTGTTTLNVKGGVSVGEEETPPVGSFLAYYNIDILENSPDVEAGEIKVVHYVTLYQRPALTQTWQDQLLSVSVRVVICNVETKMVPKIYL